MVSLIPSNKKHNTCTISTFVSARPDIFQKKKKSINLTKKMLMEGLSAHYDKIRGEILLGFKVKGDIATALYFRPPCARAQGG